MRRVDLLWIPLVLAAALYVAWTVWGAPRDDGPFCYLSQRRLTPCPETHR